MWDNFRLLSHMPRQIRWRFREHTKFCRAWEGFFVNVTLFLFLETTVSAPQICPLTRSLRWLLPRSIPWQVKQNTLKWSLTLCAKCEQRLHHLKYIETTHEKGDLLTKAVYKKPLINYFAYFRSSSLVQGRNGHAFAPPEFLTVVLKCSQVLN